MHVQKCQSKRQFQRNFVCQPSWNFGLKWAPAWLGRPSHQVFAILPDLTSNNTGKPWKTMSLYLYPPTPLAAGRARQRRNYQQQGQQGARRSYRQQGARSKKKGEGAVFEFWQPCVSKLGGGQKKKTASFLSVQKATLGTTGRCPEARSVLHCHAV